MRHEKGRLQGQRFHLEDWQAFILCSIFGFVDETGTRKYREAFILCPRGNGKSPLAAIIAIWMAFFDGEKGSEVYCGAQSEKQAWEVFRPAKAMLEQNPELVKRYGLTLAAKSLFQASTRSRFLPVIGKPGDGASVYCAILDEWHEAEDATQYDTFKTGANKRKNSLMLEISTAGITTEGPCHEKQREVEAMLDGTAENDRLFGLIYGIDPDTDWTTREALVMANPNLGISNDEEALLLDQAEAVRNPAKQNIFKTKHLNVWCTALSAWMNMSYWAKCVDRDLTWESVKHLPCWIGADCARNLDLSAVVFLFREDKDGQPHYYCFTRSFLPETRVQLPENQHYQKWAADKWLTSMVGSSSTDWPLLKAEVIKQATGLKVKEFIYDPMFADEFSQYVSDQLGIPRVEMPPKRDVLTPPMRELEAAVADGRFHFDGNPILTWCMGNVLVSESSVTNLYSIPSKNRPENKIDCAVALFTAMARAMLAPVDTDPGYGIYTF
jgi:phage terminase large subunit-like protein